MRAALLLIVSATIAVAEAHATAPCASTCGNKDLCCIEEVCIEETLLTCEGLPINPAQQGIAWRPLSSGERFITARGVCEIPNLPPPLNVALSTHLYSYDPVSCDATDTGTNQAECSFDSDKDSAINRGVQGCHIGDVSLTGDGTYVLVPVTDFTQVRGWATNVELVRRNASTLSHDTFWNITELEPGDLAGVAVDDTSLWGVGFRVTDETAGTKLQLVLKWSSVDGEGNPTWKPTGTPTEYVVQSVDSNGILIYPPYLFIAGGHPDDDEPGRIDVYDLAALDSGPGPHAPLQTYTYDVGGQSALDHAEGLTIRSGARDELWGSASGGSRARHYMLPGVLADCGNCSNEPTRTEKDWYNCSTGPADEFDFEMEIHTDILGARVRKGVPFKNTGSTCNIHGHDVNDPDDRDNHVHTYLHDGGTPNDGQGDVASGQTITIATELCQNGSNAVRFLRPAFLLDGSVVCATPETGAEILIPVDQGGGTVGHTVTIFNDSPIDLELRNLEAMASMTRIPNLGTLEIAGPTKAVLEAGPVIIGRESSASYVFQTSGRFSGGHIYLRYEISNVANPTNPTDWDRVLFDHPVPVGPVPASDPGALYLLFLALLASGLCFVVVRRRRA